MDSDIVGRTMKILDSRGQEIETRSPTGWRGLSAPVEWAPMRKGAVPVWKVFAGAAAYAALGFMLVFFVLFCVPHIRASLGQLAAVGAMVAGLILILPRSRPCVGGAAARMDVWWLWVRSSWASSAGGWLSCVPRVRRRVAGVGPGDRCYKRGDGE